VNVSDHKYKLGQKQVKQQKYTLEEGVKNYKKKKIIQQTG